MNKQTINSFARAIAVVALTAGIVAIATNGAFFSNPITPTKASSCPDASIPWTDTYDIPEGGVSAHPGAYHNDKAGCDPTTKEPGSGFSVEVDYEAGTYTASWDPNADVQCGRYQVDVSWQDANGNTIPGVGIGVVLNWGKDCGTVPPPDKNITADIKANGSDGPITIQNNTSANISWTSKNANSCVISPTGWTGISGSQSSGALTSTVIYTVTCQGPAGTATDSVTVNVDNNQCVPPIVTTNAATNVTQTSATISGTVNPNGNATTVWFEYGTNQNNLTQTSQQIMNGTGQQQVTAQLSNLQPNTTYYFRLVAQNFCGGANVLGSLMTFTTGTSNNPTADIRANGSDGPITIQYNSAANITWTSNNTVSCNVSPTGWSGTNNTVGQSTGNLTASQTYTLYCTGTNGQQVTDSVTVNVSDSCVAPSITTLAATNITQNSATLNATIMPNGSQTTAWFEYGTSQNLGYTTPTQTISGSTATQNIQAQIYNLQPNTLYYFRVIAQNPCGGANVQGSLLTFNTGTNNNITADIKANGQDGTVTVSYNSSALITWTSTNASYCTVSPTGWTGTQGSNNSQNITGTITYNLTCTGYNGQTATDYVTVQPTGSGNLLPTVVLNANPTVINLGQSSVLSWYSTNATYCYASGGPWSGSKSLSGSETVNPSITSTYTITCSNNYGSASDTETVYVNQTGGTTVSVTKLARNITQNQTNFQQSITAAGSDTLEFEIRVRNTESYSRTITVQDTLPSELYYVTGSTTIDGNAASDGITSGGLNLGLMYSNQERVIRFRANVFYGTTSRTITNQATATSDNGGYGTGFATIQIGGGQVLGAADIVTGSDDALLISIIIGLIVAAVVQLIGKKRGWFVATKKRIEESKRDIEIVLSDLAKKAQNTYQSSQMNHTALN